MENRLDRAAVEWKSTIEMTLTWYLDIFYFVHLSFRLFVSFVNNMFNLHTEMDFLLLFHSDLHSADLCMCLCDTWSLLLHLSAKGRKFFLFIDYSSSDEGEGEDVLSGVWAVSLYAFKTCLNGIFKNAIYCMQLKYIKLIIQVGLVIHRFYWFQGQTSMGLLRSYCISHCNETECAGLWCFSMWNAVNWVPLSLARLFCQVHPPPSFTLTHTYIHIHIQKSVLVWARVCLWGYAEGWGWKLESWRV